MKKLNRAILLSCALVANTALAGPWLLPGNVAVKSDVDLLADAGLIKAPVMTWPIAWVNIGPELLSPETQKKLPTEPQSVQQAYQRIVKLYEKSYQLNKSQESLYAAGSNRLNPFRTFAYQPYAKFASGASASYQTKHFAGSLNASYYHTPNQSYTTDGHLDNSYFYLLSENWAFGVDQFNRWWGPGYSDAMILSQNAEPFPAISVHRMQARAFKTKWLHWIGPWTVNSVLSEDGPYPAGVDNKLFWFTNISFRPLTSLQFDIYRNVLFAGKQRPVTAGMIWYMLTLRNAAVADNVSHDSVPAEDIPGSELWDIGTKWSLLSTFHVPITLYQQTTFSDESNLVIVPERTTFLLGGSLVSQLTPGTLRTYFEYEYNIENVFWWWNPSSASPPAADVNVYGGQYPYTYHGNVFGSPLGSEGIGYTLGANLNEADGNSDTASIRFIKLNSMNSGIAGTPGYPFSKQDLIWSSIGRTIILPHHIGSLNGEIGYLFSMNGDARRLASGISATFSWSKYF